MVGNLFGNTDGSDEELEPAGSVSHVHTETDSWATVSFRGFSASVRQTELKRRQAELVALRDLDRPKALRKLPRPRLSRRPPMERQKRKLALKLSWPNSTLKRSLLFFRAGLLDFWHVMED